MGEAVLEVGSDHATWFEVGNTTPRPAFTHGGEYIVVTVIGNMDSTSYFENGRFQFTKTQLPTGRTPPAVFVVQLVNPNQSTTVEFSHFRGYVSDIGWRHHVT